MELNFLFVYVYPVLYRSFLTEKRGPIETEKEGLPPRCLASY